MVGSNRFNRTFSREWNIGLMGLDMFKVSTLILAFTLPVSTATSGLEPKTARCLELAEAYYGAPIFVTSAYRSEEHNKEVGGVPNSQHLFGRAVDIRMPNSATQLNKLIWALSQAGFTSVGVYNNHLHGDTRNTCVFWRD